ncbi:thioesterase family protein [Desulfuromonas sp. CSMB_57]|jgi:YbgC/YbaW family acyl-CoA thioester hydrolase|uniref:acyl-CoA thioesterase n=1 Tax=Desulfuromonas sp. CSMB_57 TaxID=2807629 RepID=UPI001CD7A4D6|nr:thioesterase family protein [Desulfuromonas sp. CSMB_57]
MEGFRFTMPYTVRIADINYGGHVANSAVLNFFQEARIAYLGQLGPFSELDLGGCGIILPEAQVRYRAEMFHGDPLLIGVRIESMKNSSMMMAYRIDREGQVVAEGTTALVAFDYQTRRPVRLPEGFRRAVARFEELPG